MRKLEADVLIIGSGPGGAMTAAVLAEAGKHVMIIEEGDHVPVGATEPYSLDDMDKKWRNGGLTPAFGPVKVTYVEGACLARARLRESGSRWMKAAAGSSGGRKQASAYQLSVSGAGGRAAESTISVHDTPQVGAMPGRRSTVSETGAPSSVSRNSWVSDSPTRLPGTLITSRTPDITGGRSA